MCVRKCAREPACERHAVETIMYMAQHSDKVICNCNDNCALRDEAASEHRAAFLEQEPSHKQTTTATECTNNAKRKHAQRHMKKLTDLQLRNLRRQLLARLPTRKH